MSFEIGPLPPVTPGYTPPRATRAGSADFSVALARACERPRATSP